MTDEDNNRIQVFTSERKFLRVFEKHGEGRWPVGIAVDTSGVVYASENGAYISVFTSEGQFETSFGKRGRGPGEFNGLSGLAVDSSGTVYACDTFNYRIQIF